VEHIQPFIFVTFGAAPGQPPLDLIPVDLRAELAALVARTAVPDTVEALLSE
jgi:hypothetical protein